MTSSLRVSRIQPLKCMDVYFVDPKLIFPALEYDKFLKPLKLAIVVRNYA